MLIGAAAAEAPEKSDVLLMCREVEVQNLEQPDFKERVALFFDVGSQK